RAQGEWFQGWPQILPGGKAVLFTSVAGNDDASIQVVSLKDRRRKTIQRRGTFGRYLPSGHLVYVNDGTLFAVAFDLAALQVAGMPVQLPVQVSYHPLSGAAQLDFSGRSSEPGMLLYRSGGAEGGEVTVAWLDSEGKTQPLLAKPGRYENPRL